MDFPTSYNDMNA